MTDFSPGIVRRTGGVGQECLTAGRRLIVLQPSSATRCRRDACTTTERKVCDHLADTGFDILQPCFQNAGMSRFRAFRTVFLATFVVAAFLLSPPTVRSLAAKDPAAAKTASFADPRNDLPGLKNFAKVSDTLYRGAQPSKGGFETLKSQGIKTVVDLRDEHSDRAMLRGIGLRYLEIPCDPWSVKQSQIDEFLKVVRDPKNQPVFVHCAYGSDRTGIMVGAYRMLDQNRTADQAIQELRRFGYHPEFVQILAYLQKLDAAAVRAKLDAAPQPKVETIP